MISIILFSLSALCFGAMLTPGKSSGLTRQTSQVYTYYVCDSVPTPTWKRKAASKARVANMVG